MTLKELSIQNIVLIESATVPFAPGFNVLSGETGSGKSALMETLRLISGERADSDLIRHGAEKGSAIALFDWHPALKPILTEAGIDFEEGEPLIIRRDVASSGKGRAFVNHQPAQLTLLRHLSHLLYDQIGQHANRRLLSIEEHRALLDLYAGIDVEPFSKSWEEENRCQKQLDGLINSAAERARQIEVCQREVEELREASLQEGEEETLFAEYTRLIHADELAAHLNSLVEMLTHERQGIIPSLSRQRGCLEKVLSIDLSFKEVVEAIHNVTTELQEAAYTLEKGLDRCESQPERSAELNDRLAQLNKLKRKYGATVAEMQDYLKQTEKKLVELEHCDEAIDALKIELETVKQKTDQLAQGLTKMRKLAAKALSEELTPHLQALNMPKAQFEIEVSPQSRNAKGDDRIEFFLKPNVGEKRLAIKDFASGGELSRVMLALQTLLAGKQEIPTLVFDEIDANIGGTTATVVGEHLRLIGTKHQVIAITHFPQVAQKAEHHLQIIKREVDGRTLTEITPLLDARLRNEELSRMRGEPREL